MGAESRYEAFATQRGLVATGEFRPGPVTPLLTKGGRLEPAYSGELVPGSTA